MNTTVRKLTHSALMIALALILSMFKLFHMPFGRIGHNRQHGANYHYIADVRHQMGPVYLVCLFAGADGGGFLSAAGSEFLELPRSGPARLCDRVRGFGACRCDCPPFFK